jgi:hypothetical protein
MLCSDTNLCWILILDDGPRPPKRRIRFPFMHTCMHACMHNNARVSCLRSVALVVVDKSIGRTVVRCDFTFGLQFGVNGFGELLSELDTPLVETVDIPDSPLSKDLHLVNGNQNTQNTGGQLLKEERVGRTVSFKDLVGDEGIHGGGVHGAF